VKREREERREKREESPLPSHKALNKSNSSDGF
jgi:hypothetical protein